MQCRPLDDKVADQTKHPRLTCVRYAVCSGPRQFHAYLQGECSGNDAPLCLLDMHVFCFSYITDFWENVAEVLWVQIRGILRGQ